MKIGFVTGSLGAISGGNYVVLEHASRLRAAGDAVTLVTLDPDPPAASWHPALREVEIVPLAALGRRTFDLVVPTFWRTVYALPRLDFDRAVYFVQSIETRMQPAAPSRRREACAATYRLPLPVVTEAGWIAAYLESRHGRSVALARNGLRHDLYRPDGPAVAPPARDLRVLVEGPLGQRLKNVARTLALLRGIPGIEVWLLTQSGISRYPGVARVFSRLPIGEVPAIYRACDVLVKLSFVEGMFGPPLEMFGCGGTAVVYDVTGADEYIVDGRNGLVCPRNDEDAVVAAIGRLAADRALLGSLRANAVETARAWPSWDAASSVFRDALLRQAGTAGDAAALREAVATLPEIGPLDAPAAKRGPIGWLKPFEIRLKAYRLGLARPSDLSAFDLE